jgi:type II secretory pathway component PulK
MVRMPWVHIERTRAAVRGERGIALVAVLGFLAVMSLIAIGIVGASRTTVVNASRSLVRVQAQAAVESAVNQAIAELVAARTLVPDIVAAPRRVDVDGFTVVVSARPEHTKIDLNYADATLLAIMFRAGGADPDTAQSLAAAVEDWRDGDDLLHLKGAERRDYEEAGLKYGPANAFFADIAELRLVRGVTQRLFDCLRPELTIYSQRQGIDIDNAAPLIRAAAGVDDAANEGKSKQSVISDQAIAAGDVFEIVAHLDDAKRGIRRAERVIVRLTGNPRDPYWIMNVEAAYPIEEAAKRSCPQTARP